MKCLQSWLRLDRLRLSIIVLRKPSPKEYGKGMVVAKMHYPVLSFGDNIGCFHDRYLLESTC